MFGLWRELIDQIRVARERDPAARSTLEIIFCYPGLHAILNHRIAHWLWTHRFRFCARWLSYLNRMVTKIDIHPAAQIGRGLFIDHGAGLVIGETAEIGDNCTLFHGVTLGGTGKQTGKRHLTLHDNVTICADAQILGAIELGDNAVVGAGAVVLDNVPANATAVGIKARVVKIDGNRVYSFEHNRLPHPEEVDTAGLLQTVKVLAAVAQQQEADRENLLNAITRLEEQVRSLQAQLTQVQAEQRREELLVGGR